MMSSREMARPSISLIIAVYKHPDFLEKIFLSLQNQTCANFEVLIADDGSGPEVASVVAAWQGRLSQPIRHVWHPDDGFRKTIIVNCAAAQAAAPYLVFIDGDCILHHRFLERHLFRRKNRQVLSGRRIMLTRAFSATIRESDVLSQRIEKISYWWQGAHPPSRRHGLYMPFIYGLKNINRDRNEILGSNFAVTKADFLAVNGYDERIIGRGLEDNNLCSRFILAGMALKTIACEALQYHLYHNADPIPHSREVIRQYQSPESAWTPFGVVKQERPDPTQ
jgi:glycosyltransferase involved in cell wall biosynthesis